ncbi:TetR/AcrR family transcriptional regulator [Subtercola sp. YIM 133946]|uniref:TetR/AcrR family transcriptional regulator n=1 Tax=Subtercola sp. YIM 133946 TaxID=3118909 RepID=UPI002F94F238
MTDESIAAALPHAVALSWGIAERPERGPKRELSIERIVESAIELADVEGLGAVSMSRVAASLGFTTMSLYRYVTSKDDLLLLMQDQALLMPVPPDDAERGWREQLREWVLLTQQAYAAHPWFAEIVVTGVLLTPNNLRLVDWGLRCLASTGLEAGDKLAIVLLLGGYARAGGGAASVAGRESGQPDLSAALQELVSDERFPYLRPALVAGQGAAGSAIAALGRPPTAGGFEFGLDRYLDGVEHYLGQSAPERGQARAAAASEATDDRLAFYRKDPAVREAAEKRREAESRLREALKREREQIAKARERAAKLAARAR